MQNNFITQITELKSLNSTQLRKRWKDLYGNNPPQVSKSFLQRRLAYRLQELAIGVSNELEKRLDAQSKAYQINKRRDDARMLKPLAGSKLVRTYKGQEYQVTVLADGYEYNGSRFSSLTRIACDITKTWVSGPVFFGLTTRKIGGRT